MSFPHSYSVTGEVHMIDEEVWCPRGDTLLSRFLGGMELHNFCRCRNMAPTFIITVAGSEIKIG